MSLTTYKTTLMKYFALLAFVLLFLSGNAQLLKTKLEITVLNTAGNREAGAEVKIFDNEEDYLAGENEVQGKQFTNSKGIVLYKDLEEKEYYIQVQKGSADNYDESTKTIPLKPGVKNRVNVVITKGD